MERKARRDSISPLEGEMSGRTEGGEPPNGYAERDPVESYLTRVESLIAADPRLTPLSSGILAAAQLGIVGDSIAFCRALDVSHALVLREISDLEELELLRVTRRDTRTSRTFYELVPLEK
jgi:hypothetical protein